MLEWTGERFLPWIEDAAVAYEHLHRYAYATEFVAGKRVIDIGSGEGYGASLLARTASSVIGFDVDLEAVSHAQRKYSRPNLNFVAASAAQLPSVDPVDVVVCFETLEHIDNQEDLVREAKRLLTAEGLLIISTPDKKRYSDEAQYDNPFHTRELYVEEFQELLRESFRAVRLLGQRVYCNSNIWPLEQSEQNEVTEFLIERRESEFQITESKGRVPVYHIALASDSAERLALAGSVLIDRSNEFIRHAKAVEEAAGKLQEEIQAVVRERQEALDWKETQIRDLEAAAQSKAAALEWRASQVHSLEKENRHLEEQMEAKTREADEAVWELVTIKSTRGWALLEKLRRIRRGLFGD